nr:fragmentin, granule protein=RNK protease 1 homolog [rats, inbred F344, large granular lymphocyte leukemia cell line RNK-16, Peptide Partial, 16 aa] [Rattus sp.]
YSDTLQEVELTVQEDQ